MFLYIVVILPLLFVIYCLLNKTVIKKLSDPSDHARVPKKVTVGSAYMKDGVRTAGYGRLNADLQPASSPLPAQLQLRGYTFIILDPGSGRRNRVSLFQFQTLTLHARGSTFII